MDPSQWSVTKSQLSLSGASCPTMPCTTLWLCRVSKELLHQKQPLPFSAEPLSLQKWQTDKPLFLKIYPAIYTSCHKKKKNWISKVEREGWQWSKKEGHWWGKLCLNTGVELPRFQGWVYRVPRTTRGGQEGGDIPCLSFRPYTKRQSQG